MTIKRINEGSSLTFAISGRLESLTAPELEKAVKEELDGVTNLVFDLSALDYISSAGLRVLLAAQKIMDKQNGKMKITGANEIVQEVFDITGFSDILTIE